MGTSDGHQRGETLMPSKSSQLPARQLVPNVPLGGSPFPPIADYGFLSDCLANALVAPSGSIEWMCLPRSDSPSVLAAILDRDAGHFRLGPAGVNVPASRRYLPGTMAGVDQRGDTRDPGRRTLVRERSPWRA